MVLMRVTKLIAQPSLDPIEPDDETTVKHQKPSDLSQTQSDVFALGETKLQISKTRQVATRSSIPAFLSHRRPYVRMERDEGAILISIKCCDRRNRAYLITIKTTHREASYDSLHRRNFPSVRPRV